MALVLSLVLALVLVAPPASPAGADDGDPRRLVSILDYIGSDYAGSVADGRVVDELEYVEQREFILSASRIAAGFGPPAADSLGARLAVIAARIDAKAEAAEVAALCRVTRQEVVTRFALATAPDERPSLATARALFDRACAQCHGQNGDGNTALAATLEPRPMNFRDADRLAVLSPHRVFNTLTFGVPGTAMASFAALSPAERWSLAFYVLRLGHAGPRPGRVAAFGLDELARSTDAELRDRLRGAVEPREVGAALAFLRTEAPFVAPSASEGIAMARTFLDRADVAYREGRTGDAERALVDAYLKGFEPLEPTLIARDPGLVQELESAFGELRRSIALGVAAQEFSGQVASLERRLHDAVGGARVLTPFLSAFVVVLREGVEAALLIAALLAGARRLGRAHAARGIHFGWIAALPAGVLTWWVFDRLVRAGAAQRELVEALVTLAAAAVLFSVSSWMLSRTNPRRWSDGVQRSLTSSLEAATPWPVIGLAFLAVYREAAETVLFLQAILFDARGAESQVWAGGAAGLLLSFTCAFVMTRAIARLPLTPFFAVTGVLLSLLAVSFAGSGIYTLVVAGHLKARPVQFPEIPWMGIHPDLSGLLVQLAIAATLVLGALLTHGRREAAASASDSREDG